MDDKPEKMIYEGVPKESPSEGKDVQERIANLKKMLAGFERINKILDDNEKANNSGTPK